MMLGKRILVVEDEYLLAADLSDALENAGFEVLGPVPDVSGGLALVEQEERIDGALLDINLAGTLVYPLADTLTARAVPFAFASGFDQSVLPERFAGVARLEKPVSTRQALATLAQIMA